jgi:hypothetical protein
MYVRHAYLNFFPNINLLAVSGEETALLGFDHPSSSFAFNDIHLPSTYRRRSTELSKWTALLFVDPL